ncbi:MAG: hypothetical protein JSR48_07145 [Verrucomicrobia bacterium]|nr:hypothetical protein [Verrucomicrobiota bacterium]
MGFFDRFLSKSNPAESQPAPAEPSASGGGVLPQLVTARERLEAKDLPGALAIYEQVLASAGDRADVLVTISGDLGVTGHVQQIVELVAPRYDAERHGPATGLNLVQAYLALRQADAAQHVLDILFALQRPELEDRLHGFSNAIAELIHTGARPVDHAPAAAEGAEAPKVNFVSLSRPIWSYGLESLSTQILPAKGEKLRRVAFTQLALLGVPDLDELMARPETDEGRLTRAIPLWLAETFYFSAHYSPIAVIGVMDRKHHVVVGAEWSMENLRQLAETTEGGLDYIFTGALKVTGGDHELVLRVFEVKKFRERKTIKLRWTPATADSELTQLHEHIRSFMEWSPESSGLTYSPPSHPAAWLATLGSSLSLFLADKELLAREQLVLPSAVVNSAAEQAVGSEAASLAWLTLSAAARRHGLVGPLAEIQLRPTPLVKQAREALG